MRQKLSLLLLSSLLLGGCTPIEKVAYRTVVGAKGFLDSVKQAHPECTNPVTPSPRICVLLVQATSAKDLLIDAGEAYCSGQGFGQPGIPCNAPKKGTPEYQIAIDKLNGALANYEQTEKDLKGIIQ